MPPLPARSLPTGTAPCPCGSTDAYSACCGPLHAHGAALTAEALMRSRYSAFALGLSDHLFRTWHPRTRPARIDLDPETRWTGLRVLRTESGGVDDDEGRVEFQAFWRQGTQQGVLHENSRFQRRAGRWLYLDGEVD